MYARLNPAFGSGATKSAVDAVTLDSLLRTIEVNGRSNCFECVPTTGVSRVCCVYSLADSSSLAQVLRDVL